MEKSTAEVEKRTAELEDEQSVRHEVQKSHETLLSWADMYDQSNLETRKMIAAKLIKQIRLKRNYEVEIDFNISYQDYCGRDVRFDESVQVETVKPA